MSSVGVGVLMSVSASWMAAIIPSPSKSTFTIPMSAPVVLVPLHDHTAWHAGVLEWDDLIESPLTDHHPPECWSQMPREVLDYVSRDH